MFPSVARKKSHDHVAAVFVGRVVGRETCKRQCNMDEVVLRGVKNRLFGKVPAV